MSSRVTPYSVEAGEIWNVESVSDDLFDPALIHLNFGHESVTCKRSSLELLTA